MPVLKNIINLLKTMVCIYEKVLMMLKIYFYPAFFADLRVNFAALGRH